MLCCYPSRLDILLKKFTVQNLDRREWKRNQNKCSNIKTGKGNKITQNNTELVRKRKTPTHTKKKSTLIEPCFPMR